jgi:hypothetical protein
MVRWTMRDRIDVDMIPSSVERCPRALAMRALCTGCATAEVPGFRCSPREAGNRADRIAPQQATTTNPCGENRNRSPESAR